jgi:hypothetical protein
MIRLLLGACLAVALWGSALADDKKPDDKKPAKKSGTVTGTLVAKPQNAIEVKADGEEKPRRYVPHWLAGGFDKKMLATFKDLKVGSRVRLEWEFDERARVVKIEVLKVPDEKKDKEKDR